MTSVTRQSEIPKAPYYVVTIDTFMSGWGPAREKINRLIFPCESIGEANRLYDYAKSRTDQKNVRICFTKPKVYSHHYAQVKTRDDYPTWYSQGI